ncbi:translocation/assembly module TamB domain-containing protein [Qipengyuania atrilutea]|uniref:Translocation/assembly module TamB domain-containing protein n=1 Tax=Qipengyuania atrilutea TaxID=2744473 RepID=A0A850H8B6_9SPHN|nr:translocation/assembly module TamB domain-containing protein [Actirhodobacter atriluteus]NVD45485.1 translocation/assembly module TamB domain-containing protein [Actirhodobacter atriluteus]
MSEAVDTTAANEFSANEEPGTPRRSKRKLALKWFAGIAGLLLLAVAALLVFINSDAGRRYVAERIAEYEMPSGLKVEIGRIEGDIYGSSVLYGVALSDPQGVFMRIPRAELDWRPRSWLSNRLDIRSLAIREGTLLRWPKFIDNEDDGPILPDFDIRIDRLVIDDLRLAEGLLGERAQRVNLLAQARVDEGTLLLKANGRLGERDRVYLDLDARPDDDRFDLALDYRAPEGGVVAGLLGVAADYRAIATGEGRWSNWRGALLLRRDEERLGAFRLTNRSGRFGLVGQANLEDITSGLAQRAAGNVTSIAAFASIAERVIDGEFGLRSRALSIKGEGRIDLAQSRIDNLSLVGDVRDPGLFGSGFALEDARFRAQIDGPFSQLEGEHTIIVPRLEAGNVVFENLVQEGVLSREEGIWRVPLSIEVGRVRTGQPFFDPRLQNGTLRGTLTLNGNRLLGEDLALSFPETSARLTLAGDLARSQYRIAGPVRFERLLLENIGRASGTARIDAVLRAGRPWRLQSIIDGVVAPVTNGTLASLAGERITANGGLAIGGGQPLTFRNVSLASRQVTMNLDGQITGEGTSVAGTGRHQRFGQFTVEALLTPSGPRAAFVFADPFPAAGLRDVRLALTPTEQGFAIETEGQSLLGPFDGTIGLLSSRGGATRLSIERLNVWETAVRGQLTLVQGGVDGTLSLIGGGLDGTIGLEVVPAGQRIALDIEARNAEFGGTTPIAVARADIEATGVLGARSTIQGNLTADGISYGRLFVGRLAARGELEDGVGEVTASISGRRGARFNLQMNAGITPQRVAFAARGAFAGQQITMPRRAVLVKQDSGAWRLQRSQVSYGDGRLILEGLLGGESGLQLRAGLSQMPLSLIDIAVPDLGLGGTASGVIEFRQGNSGLPVADVRVKIDDLTRSGLVLSSRPIDLALVSELTENRLVARAVLSEAEERKGRLQARISNLPQSGVLGERIRRGRLFAQLRYQGQASALWRLTGVEAFDLTGPVSIAADARGTLADPSVRGSVESDNLRVRSLISGTDINNVAMNGSFSGSRLRLQRFSGTTAGGGRITGSGTVDLQGLGERVEGRMIEIRGPKLDLRAYAERARLVNANGLSATVSGPLRIVSNGLGGTIAGRVEIIRASWSLGTAAEDAALPRIVTREVNVPANVSAAVAPGRPWRYLIDAQGNNRINVEGLGIDSEWAADIVIRGTTSDPRIGGSASVVRGNYSFAGTRFDLTRGEIAFDEDVPIDPRLDIEAETRENGIEVTVDVTGSAQEPEISFRSVPSLPEEEILSRLLFGGSITSLSATDALQLGSALASLREGGAGLDPINQLRSAIGLDRLRIVSADAALDRGTAIAVGKNIGRRFYIELITDGRGYSATEVEFRVTSWLSLLASVSTIGRDSVVAEISRDY